MISGNRTVKVKVFHGSYGCESGCCGHWFEGVDEHGRFTARSFDFGHLPDEIAEEWCITEAKHRFGEHVEVEIGDIVRNGDGVMC